MFIQDFCNLGDTFHFTYSTKSLDINNIFAITKNEIIESNKDYIFVFPVKFKFRVKNIKPFKIENNVLHFQFTPRLVGIWSILIHEDNEQIPFISLEVR